MKKLLMALIVITSLWPVGNGWLKAQDTLSEQMANGNPIDLPVIKRDESQFLQGSAASTTIVAIEAGSSHTCALTNGGAVKCWGYNGDGELGNGTTTDSLTPVDVVGLSSGVIAITVDYRHTCALTSGGGVKCWGENALGLLNDGTTTSSIIPVDVIGLSSGVSAIATGYGHTCALTNGGAVKCWGGNGYAELGDGTRTSSLTPVNVAGLSTGVTAIDAGHNYTCAVVNGGAKCWGDNSNGQLGNDSINSLIPTDVSGLASGVTAIKAGYGYTCAVANSAAKCWGYGGYGALGDGTTTSRFAPMDVSGLTNGVIAIAVEYRHTCAVTSSGGAKCWGFNDYGQLGDGTTTNSLTPIDVVGLSSGAVAIDVGYTHTCAVTSSGGAKCWGDNTNGQLGDGTTASSLIPVDVVGLGQGTPTPTPVPTATATPGLTPTPTPDAQSCVLSAFADTTNGNPIQQNTQALLMADYGGREFDIPGRGPVFLPFRWTPPTDTIYEWGCKLISGAMIINYYAAQQGVAQRTDPIMLNDWMAHNLTNGNSGYSSGLPLDDTGQVNWQNPTHVIDAYVDSLTLVQYANAHGIDMAIATELSRTSRTTATDDLLDQSLCDLNPAILGVTGNGHYVVASGKTTVSDTATWRLHDPLASTPTNLLDAYENKYGNVTVFEGKKPRSAILLSLYSPAEVVVVDPQGRRAGLDPRTGTLFEEIPSSSYGQEFLAADDGTPGILERKVLYIGTPLSGEYSVEVIGTGNGEIGLDVVSIDTNGTGPRITTADTVAPGVANIYRLTYSVTPGTPTQFVRLMPPTANAGGSYAGRVGEPITFNASGSFDPDGTIVLYEWDFESDGVFDVSSPDPTAIHAYPATFSGTATLRVTDNDGTTGTDTAQVQTQDVSTNLSVVKIVINDHGGSKTASDFPLYVDGNSVTSGMPTTVAPGAHIVSEQSLPGYTATFSGDCNTSGLVMVNAGESKTCTITNDDQPGSIEVIKDAVPDDPQDFAFNGALGVFMLDDDPSNAALSNQVAFTNLSSGVYDISETAANGWNVTGITCNDSDSSGNLAARTATVNLQLGENVTCTFTNQRQAGTIVGVCGGYTVYQTGSTYSAPGWSGTIKVGTNANNTINGTSGADLILGLGGSDKIYGKGGDDVICGGAGNDLIEGGAGNDTLDGGEGNDLLRGEQGDYDVLLGGAGNDGLFDPDGVDGIYGGIGNDLLTFALRKGWRDRTGATRFAQKLSGGYQDDVVIFSILDRNTFFVDITGDERDNPPASAEGRNDILALTAKLDPASVIMKFEHPLVKAAGADTIDQMAAMEQQYARQYGFVLDEAGEEDAEQDATQDNRFFLPFIMP